VAEFCLFRADLSQKSGPTVIATLSWNLTTNGAWTTGADWTNTSLGTTGAVPTASDTVLISAPGTYTVTWTGKGASASQSAAAVTVASANATLQIQGGRTLTVANSLLLNSGTVVEGGGLVVAGITQTGGLLASTGTLTASGAIILNGGTAAIAGGTVSVTHGGLAIGGGALSITGGAASVTDGVTLQSGSLSLGSFGTATYGTLAATGLAITGGRFSQSGSASSLSLSGAASISGATASLAAGTFQVSAGGLALSRGASLLQSGGSLAVSNGLSLNASSVSLSGGQAQVVSGGLTLAAAASLGQTAGTLLVAGGGSLDASQASLGGGLFYVQSGGLALSHASTLLTNGGSVVVTGDTTLNASQQTVAAGSFYGYLGGLSLTGGSTLSVTGGAATFDNTAALTASTELVSGGTFYVDAGAAVMTAGNSLTVNGGVATFAHGATADASSVLVSAGTFYMVGGGLTLTDASRFSLTGGLSEAWSGAIVSAGAIATLSGGRFLVESGNLVIGSTASLSASGGTQSMVYGTEVDGGTLAVSGSADFAANWLSVNSGSFSQTGAAVTVTQGATFAAAASIGAGQFSAGTVLVNAGSLALTGGTLASTAGGISIAAGATLQLAGTGAVLDASHGGLTDQGTLSGFGQVLGSIASSGPVIADAGVLDLAGAVAAGTRLQVAGDAGSILRLDGSVAAGATVGFAGTHGVLELNDTAGGSLLFNGTVTGLGQSMSATPDLSGLTYINLQTPVTRAQLDSASVIGLYNGSVEVGTIALAAAPGMQVVPVLAADASLAGHQIGSGTDLFLFDNAHTSDPVCYAAGTLILTPAGEVPVETLRPGERVLIRTAAGLQPRPIRWVGHRFMDLARHPAPEQVAPIRIRRDALGPGCPRRDVLVSPPHALLIDGVLIPAKLLLNGMTVVAERSLPAVTYYHVELDHHAVLLAEGMAAESYLDTGNRRFFANGDGPLDLRVRQTDEPGPAAGPHAWCAPLLTDRDRVLPHWQRLAARAEGLGYRRENLAVTADPDLHLIIEGRPLRPVSVSRGRATFLLRSAPATLRLASRSVIPADTIDCCDDLRRLGVAVTRVVLRAGADRIDLPPDHPALTQGWHDVERGDGRLWRWTNGGASVALPVSIRSPWLMEVWHQGQLGYPLSQTAPSRTDLPVAA
jgi:hypothetical protein